MGRRKEEKAIAGSVPVDSGQPVRRQFPGPRGRNEPLRVAIAREAYANIALHAKESLDVEVCGVLVGLVCVDDEGLFLDVSHVIRGKSTREGATHVTFTQETWNAIHEEMAAHHSGLRVVGWYHSHPGFGLELSDMDKFIQKNFFPSDTQVALVTDPLAGQTSVAVNSDDGVRYLKRLWVDGREQLLATFSDRDEDVAARGARATGNELRAIENRLTQLVQAVDEQIEATSRSLATLWIVVGCMLVLLLGFQFFRYIFDKYTPPRGIDFMQIPVSLGNETVMVGVDVVSWKVPPELEARWAASMLDQIRKEMEAQQVDQSEAPRFGCAGPERRKGPKALRDDPSSQKE